METIVDSNLRFSPDLSSRLRCLTRAHAGVTRTGTPRCPSVETVLLRQTYRKFAAPGIIPAVSAARHGALRNLDYLAAMNQARLVVT
jgi:hypothetical protein